MDKIRLTGGRPLKGEIPISGAKNAALPLMIAGLLSSDSLDLSNVPRLADTALMKQILGAHGAHVAIAGRLRGESPLSGERLVVGCPDITNYVAAYDLVSKMRAGFWVIGALLAREGKARVSLPGGCAIGTRPLDLFLTGLESLGAVIDVDRGYVNASAPKGLIGADIIFPKVSVGATHTLMMAAVLAKGTTRLSNAAREPEIVNLAECLISMGAKISGQGSTEIVIEGVDSLHAGACRVIPDRIEAGTYMIAAAATGGEVVIKDCKPDHLTSLIAILRQTGTEVDIATDQIMVRRTSPLKPVNVETRPYPGFATDLQAQMMALLCYADGRSRVRETIFENRFMHVQELARLGAHIDVQGDTAFVNGNTNFRGAEVMATDLRASVSLVIAGLAAEGETTISRVYHLDRGFEQLETKLSACGADIQRIRS